MLQMSVVRFKEIFSTFVYAEQSAHTYGKCFLKSLYESVVVFKAEGHTDSTHSWYILLSKGVLCVPMSHIYTECWALGRLLLLRSYHNLYTGKRNPHHTFLFNNLFVRRLLLT